MTLRVDKQAVARAFGRAASHYDAHAALQRLSGDALLAQAPAQSGLQLLDAGCGTGWYSRLWRERGKQVTALDLSPQMLQQARDNDAARAGDCRGAGRLGLPDYGHGSGAGADGEGDEVLQG